MNMEFIDWPKFMPQFYTAPNASLRFKNEYNYVIANSYSIAILIPFLFQNRLANRKRTGSKKKFEFV